MKLLILSLLLIPMAALGYMPAPDYTKYTKIYEKADIFIEGHLSGKELDKIKVTTSYNSATGTGYNEFYVMTELIVDGRIQFNGHVIPPDDYIDINGEEKEVYRVYAKDGVHLNKGSTERTKAWFISRSALPKINTVFCLGAYNIDVAERTISEYMSKPLGGDDTSQNIRKKKEYAHGGDLMLSSDDLESVQLVFSDKTKRVTIEASISIESIIYQIRKNPNSDQIESKIPLLHLYIDNHLIAKDCGIYADSPLGQNKTQMSFPVDDAPEILQGLSELLK